MYSAYWVIVMTCEEAPEPTLCHATAREKTRHKTPDPAKCGATYTHIEI